MASGASGFSKLFSQQPLLNSAFDLQVISTALGYVLPNLISREATQHVATVLYTFFGLRLYWIAWQARQQDMQQARLAHPCCIVQLLPGGRGWPPQHLQAGGWRTPLQHSSGHGHL